MANRYICKLHGYDNAEKMEFGNTLYVASAEMDSLQVLKTLCKNAGKDIAKYKTIDPFYADLLRTDKWEECELKFENDNIHIIIDEEWYTITIDIQKVNQEFFFIDDLN